MTDLPTSISQVQENLLQKKHTTVELVDSYLERIKRIDSKINSFITVTEDLAYSQAKVADKLISDKGEKAFEEKPLLGSVVALKDIFLTKGIRTTAASKVLEDFIPAYSATVVTKLEQAGCIVLGKLNMDAWAHGSSGENSDFGVTHNPWDLDYVPGGSSSGSAAAVAANFCLFSTSTDTCGSTRLPANYCGLVGLKPTYGAVSRYGVVAMASSLDTMGHITHTVEDSRKIFNVTKGMDGYDSTVKSAPKEERELKHVLGIPKEFFGEGVDSVIEKNIEEVIKIYESLGFKTKEISLPHTKYGIAAYYIIQPAEVSSNLGRYDGIRYGKDRSFFGTEAKRRIMLGTYVLSSGYYDAYYAQAMKVRTIIREEVNSVFEEVDALLAPVSPTPAFKLGEKVNDPLKMYLTDIYAATANLSGIPSLAVPSGFTDQGLPLGFQIMGPRFSENVLFELGEKFQSQTDFHLKVPIL